METNVVNVFEFDSIKDLGFHLFSTLCTCLNRNPEVLFIETVGTKRECNENLNTSCVTVYIRMDGDIKKTLCLYATNIKVSWDDLDDIKNSLLKIGVTIDPRSISFSQDNDGFIEPAMVLDEADEEAIATTKNRGKVYFFLAEQLGIVKIGKTIGDPVECRKAYADSQVPETTKYLGYVEGYTEKELELHEMFSKYRINRSPKKLEWFRYEGELKEFIENNPDVVRV